MGIQGLLPFVQKATRPANIKEFSGQTAAVDTYCWLHKGAFSCAERLVKGEKTDAYVAYCMKMVDLLIACGVRPILVFDGRHLPSKKLTEKKRREQREINRQKAKQFLIEGKLQEARECYQRAVDVTSSMAHDVIEECRRRDIDYIVAPYEADAQLAYLAQTKMADVIVTEDSDLIPFGCEKVLFKMDRAGFGQLYERSKLGECFGAAADRFTLDKFRQMCILSGCDYLASLHGIGLGKACKFFKLITNPDLRATLPKLPSYLKMPSLCVSSQYIEDFLKAENTFRYQLVFCPERKELVPLNPYDPGVDPEELSYAGQHFPRDEAFDMAVGNIDVNTGQKIDNYAPKDGKVLKARRSSTDPNVQKARPKGSAVEETTPKRLGAFQVSERRTVTPATPKTPARSPHWPSKPLSSMENISAECAKQSSPLESLEGSPGNVEGSPIVNKQSGASPRRSSQVENVFKVTPRPPALRSRFFSTPPAPPSPKKKLTEWQLQLSEPSHSQSLTAAVRQAPRSSNSQGKFQWGSKFGPEDNTPTTPVSRAALTPFKRLRLNLASPPDRKKNSCVLGSAEENDSEMRTSKDVDNALNHLETSDKQENTHTPKDSSPSKILVKEDKSAFLSSTDGLQPSQNSKSIFDELEKMPLPAPKAVRPAFKNPFASVPKMVCESDLVVMESDDEDPMPRCARDSRRRESGEQPPAEKLTEGLYVSRLEDSFEENPESPIPRCKSDYALTKDARNSSQGPLDFPDSLDDGESPWPHVRTAVGDGLDSGTKEMIEESDEDDLMVTSAVIVKRPLGTPKGLAFKSRIPPKPSKKVPTGQRRVGLSKSSVTKRDRKQPSLLESLAKFQFKKSCL